MKKLIVILALVVVAGGVAWAAGKRRMPAGTSCVQTGNVGLDDNQDGVRDTCPPADAWVTSGSNYIADFNDGQYISPVILVSPESGSPTNDYVALPTGSAQLPVPIIQLCKQSWAAGTYGLSFFAATPNPSSQYLFYSWDTPVVPQPNPADGTILNQGLFTFTYFETAANRVGSAQDFQLHAIGGPNFTDNLTIDVTGPAIPHCLYVAPGPGVRMSRAVMTLGGSAPAATYDVKKVTTDYPSACSDDRFGGANQVPWTGATAPNMGTQPDVRLLWGVDSGSPFLYGCATMVDGNLQSLISTDNSGSTGNPGSPIDGGTDDALILWWRQGTATTAKDATTWEFAASAASGRSYWNFPNGTATFLALTPVTSAVTLSGTLNNGPQVDQDTNWKLFFKLPIGFTPSDNDSFRGQLRYVDKDAQPLYRQAFNFGLFSDPSQWAAMKFSGTVVPHSPTLDPTPPTLGVPSAGTPGQTSATITVTITDAGTTGAQLFFNANYQPDTTGGASPPGTYSLSAGPSSLCASGGTCSLTLNNLTAGKTYYYRVTAQDAAGNTTTLSTEATFTTAAVLGQPGQVYISPTGNDTNNGANSGVPVKTWGRAVEAAATSAGPTGPMTVIAMDGTYLAQATGGNGYLDFKCDSGTKCDGSQCRAGGVTIPVTIQAEHERKVIINGDGIADTVSIDNCPYYVLKGLVINTGDNTQGTASAGNGVKVFGNQSNNVTLERNIIKGSNRNRATVAVWATGQAQNLTLLENEVYDYFLAGIQIDGASNNPTIRRNYLNSRGASRITGGFVDPVDGRGDYGILLSAVSGGAIENNITVKNEYGLLVSPSGGDNAQNNMLLGNISYQDSYGVIAQASAGFSPKNTKIYNQVVLEPGTWGIAARAAMGTEIKNVSVLDRATNSLRGIVADAFASPNTGAGKSVCIENALTYSQAYWPVSGTGIEVTGQDAWGVNFPHSTKNGTLNTTPPAGSSVIVVPTNYTPAIGNANLTNVFGLSTSYVSTEVDPSGQLNMNPGLNYCTVTVPPQAIVSGKGRAGADIGANAVYRYASTAGSGTPSLNQAAGNELWDTTTYAFPCGATVAQLNDGGSDTCQTVHKTLRVGNADPLKPCVMPYGPSTIPTPPSPTWTAPIGIPAPSFGITETRPTLPSPWTGEVVGVAGKTWYYVDNVTGSNTKNSLANCGATSGANNYGWPTCPRLTIPNPLTTSNGSGTLPAGAVVVVNGLYNFRHNGSAILKAAGTSGSPVWIMGTTPGNPPNFIQEVTLTGSYAIADGIKQSVVSGTGGVAGGNTVAGQFLFQTSGASSDHLVVRNSEFVGNMTLRSGLGVGTPTVDKQSGTPAVSITPHREVSDVVIYNNRIHHIGDSDNITKNDQDAHAINVGSYSNNVWILDNIIHNIGGDSLQIRDDYIETTDAAICPAGPPPQSGCMLGPDVHHIYYGRNTSGWNRQTGGWSKEATDVIFSQNVTRHHRQKATSTASCYGTQYSPDWLWFIGNFCSDAEVMFRNSTDGDSFRPPGSPSEALYDSIREHYYINNVGTDIHERFYPRMDGDGDPTTIVAYRPGNSASQGIPFWLVIDRFQLAITRHYLNNTFSGVDGAFSVVSGGVSPGNNHYEAYNNIFSPFSGPADIANGADRGGYWMINNPYQDAFTKDNNNLARDMRQVKAGTPCTVNCNMTVWQSTYNEGVGEKIDNDPNFVNPAAGNFALQAGSVAIDAGDNTQWTNAMSAFTARGYGTSINVDFNGQTRTVGGTIDMGAYESQ